MKKSGTAPAMIRGVRLEDIKPTPSDTVHRRHHRRAVPLFFIASWGL